MKTMGTYLILMLFALIFMSRSMLSGIDRDAGDSPFPVEIEIFHPVKGECLPDPEPSGEPESKIPITFSEDTLQFEPWMTQLGEWTIKNN